MIAKPQLPYLTRPMTSRKRVQRLQQSLREVDDLLGKQFPGKSIAHQQEIFDARRCLLDRLASASYDALVEEGLS